MRRGIIVCSHWSAQAAAAATTSNMYIENLSWNRVADWVSDVQIRACFTLKRENDKIISMRAAFSPACLLPAAFYAEQAEVYSQIVELKHVFYRCVSLSLFRPRRRSRNKI
jgi:F420-dependent methylenetetrahydromethanopterin dehydrogenase